MSDKEKHRLWFVELKLNATVGGQRKDPQINILQKLNI
jgi:hypothetical protein